MNEQEKLKYIKRASRIMAAIAANPVSIALLYVLREASDGSAVSDKGIVGRIRVRFGEDAFSDSEIFSALITLDENLWMVKRVRPPIAEIRGDLFSPSWYSLTNFGLDAANFFKGMETTQIKSEQE